MNFNGVPTKLAEVVWNSTIILFCCPNRSWSSSRKFWKLNQSKNHVCQFDVFTGKSCYVYRILITWPSSLVRSLPWHILFSFNQLHNIFVVIVSNHRNDWLVFTGTQHQKDWLKNPRFSNGKFFVFLEPDQFVPLDPWVSIGCYLLDISYQIISSCFH